MGESGNFSSTKRTLKNLCLTNGWSYGVFWGFDQRNPMLLSVEECYYEERHFGSAIDHLLLNVHMLGEGIIGEAALNAEHQWILADGFGSNDQIDHEVCAQFSYGIKTIVVIPVEPHGVVQFGSTEKIVERLGFVDQTIRLFRETHDSDGLTPSENLHSSGKSESYDITALFSSLLPSQNSNIEKTVLPNANTACFGQLSNTWVCEFPTISASSGQDLGVDPRFFRDSSDAIHSKGDSLAGNVRMDDRQSLPSVFEGLFEDFQPDDFPTDLFNLCQVDDLSLWPDQSIDQMVSALSCDLTQLVESTSTSVAIEDPSNLVQEKSVVVQSTERDASDARRINWQCGQSGESWEKGNFPTAKGGSYTSTVISGPRKGLFSELGLEELLAGGRNSTSCLTSSSLEDNQSLTSAKRRRIESGSSSGTTSFSNDLVTHKELPKSQVGLWIDDSYSIAPSSTVLSSKQQMPEEHKKVTRKRARPGESNRPRPKDRQLIQDRIKELRGIIPNSGKCSIDSLLERTIKYMNFLQGVTKHGDKLKQPTKPKLFGSENGAVLRDKNNMGGGGGATWAYEVGGQSMGCPIIVEDLSPPGHMLIEMLCEEQGLFLEIADMIRGFGLSILKGVMEVREDKIWAHFIVEAKSHITRIDVFWSLVRLLQRTSTGTSTVNSDKHLGNAVLDGGIPLMESYQKPNFTPPMCLAETFH